VIPSLRRPPNHSGRFLLCLALAASACSQPDATDPSEDGGAPISDSGTDAGPLVDAGHADAGHAPRDAGAFEADSGPAPVLTAGASNRFLLRGTVITPSDSFDGAVLVEDSLISCVQPGTGCDSQAQGATIIETDGVISPGLIDMHNHILFDIFDNDDWLPQHPYTNHTQWTAEARYKTMLDIKQCLEDASQGKPSWCPARYNGAGNVRCEMDKWGELKGLVAGTTSIVGLPGTSSACFGSVARSIDVAQNGLAQDRVQTSAIFPPSRSAADGVCSNFASSRTNAYLVHCGEGTDATALGEFATLGSVTTTAQCLYAPQTVITHGVAFTSTEFATMKAHDMKLTWSPASNVALYGSTADIPAALDAGVSVNLGPDWSMGGSPNMLAELRFANGWDDAHWNNLLSAKDLVQMATANAAEALGLSDQIGLLAPGMKADLFVVTGDRTHPWDAIVAATPHDVRLTMVGGQLLYGDEPLAAAGANQAQCEHTVNVCGRAKFLCVAQPVSGDTLGESSADIHDLLEAALEDLDTVRPAGGNNFAPLSAMAVCE
jgi:hypothetical protein